MNCDGCDYMAYACGDNFCKHPELPMIKKGTPWPWIHDPFEVPDWCPEKEEAGIK